MLLNVVIRRPKIDDIKELNQFFRVVITDTFIKEGIGELLDEIEEEIEVKKKYIDNDLKSNGETRYFLIAFDSEKIIGSIEYGASSELICNCTNNAFKDLVEVGTVFVHPLYQRMGVGNLLLKSIYSTLKDRGIKEFCLDSGYSSAQKVWKNKFGEPEYLLKDYWSKGYDHMIWRITVTDLV